MFLDHPNVTLQLVAPGPIVYQTLPPVLKNREPPLSILAH